MRVSQSPVGQSRVASLRRTWLTRGAAPRALPPRAVQTVYQLWVLALTAKLVGSTWDMAWHFRWLRDDLAPPHLINAFGTGMVVALVVFHSYTGYGVDRIALRLMQVGVGLFLLAVPLDLLNHRINGLDITAWSPSHALLYLGTGVMTAGALRGWWLYGPPGRWRVPVLGAFWFFILETVLFPAQQQEYGVLAVAAWDRGAPDAEPILLQFAADTLGRPVDRDALVAFALPAPPWLYPVWMVAAGMLVLVLARWMIGLRFTATMLAGAFVLYRCLAWLCLVGGGFPPSAVPFLLLAGALVIDLVYLVRTPWWLPPLLGSVLVTAATYGALAAQEVLLTAPPTDYLSAAAAVLILGALWLAAAAVVRTQAFARWSSPR